MEKEARPTAMFCPNCGSIDVSIEAFVSFDTESRELVVVDSCDKGHACNGCGAPDIRLVTATDPLKMFFVSYNDTQDDWSYFVEAYGADHALLLWAWNHDLCDMANAKRIFVRGLAEEDNLPDGLTVHEVPAPTKQPGRIDWTEVETPIAAKAA